MAVLLLHFADPAITGCPCRAWDTDGSVSIKCSTTPRINNAPPWLLLPTRKDKTEKLSATCIEQGNKHKDHIQVLFGSVLEDLARIFKLVAMVPTSSSFSF